MTEDAIDDAQLLQSGDFVSKAGEDDGWVQKLVHDDQPILETLVQLAPGGAVDPCTSSAARLLSGGLRR